MVGGQGDRVVLGQVVGRGGAERQASVRQRREVAGHGPGSGSAPARRAAPLRRAWPNATRRCTVVSTGRLEPNGRRQLGRRGPAADQDGAGLDAPVVRDHGDALGLVEHLAGAGELDAVGELRGERPDVGLGVDRAAARVEQARPERGERPAAGPRRRAARGRRRRPRAPARSGRARRRSAASRARRGRRARSARPPPPTRAARRRPAAPARRGRGCGGRCGRGPPTGRRREHPPPAP